MTDGASQDHRQKVQQVPRQDADGKGDLMKDHLTVGIIGADVEHVCISVGMGQNVDTGGGCAAEKKQRDGVKKVPDPLFAVSCQGTGESDKDQDKMP